MVDHYGQEAVGTFLQSTHYVICQSNQGQSIFKELAKELHQDPAVLSRGLGKLAEELASKPELRGVDGDQWCPLSMCFSGSV
jgi:hypothetical protein